MDQDSNHPPSTKHTGRCLCGAVTYEGSGAIHGPHVCHCRQCARWGGGPAIGLEFSEGIQFQGPVKWYRSSEWAERGFCSECGSTIFYRLVDGSVFSVGAGSVDDQSALHAIGQHIFVDSKPGYYDFADNSPRLTSDEFLAMISGSTADEGTQEK
jgi:hypothetical protein